MNETLNSNTDRSTQQTFLISGEPEEHPAINWVKLIFLILLTFGLIVSMWFICMAIETMHNRSVPSSYVDGGGLLFGLFCFYVLCFGVAWYWGSGQREEMRVKAVEEQIARQKAMEAMLQLE